MNHVVLFKFDTMESAQEAARRLRALLGVVPSLKRIEVGVDALRTDRSWDLCLITRFDDADGMQAYQVHPAHQDAVTWIRARCTATAAVDWPA